jgi:hypothetical protein
LVSEFTVIGLVVPVAVCVVTPALQDAVYPVIVAPPLELGAEKLSVATVLPAVATNPVGAPGVVMVGVGAIGVL